jgi:hypothetical protein
LPPPRSRARCAPNQPRLVHCRQPAGQRSCRRQRLGVQSIACQVVLLTCPRRTAARRWPCQIACDESGADGPIQCGATPRGAARARRLYPALARAASVRAWPTEPDKAGRSQARPGQARPGQARPGQARPGQARPGQARPGQVSVRSGIVWGCAARSS